MINELLKPKPIKDAPGGKALLVYDPAMDIGWAIASRDSTDLEGWRVEHDPENMLGEIHPTHFVDLYGMLPTPK